MNILLEAPEGYDPSTQAIVGLMAAGFDDQFMRVEPTLAGLEVEHLEWLERSRVATHTLLKTWDDRSLDKIMTTGQVNLSHRWVLYHLIEHFSAHFGQILMLLHCLRDQGVPGLPEKKGFGVFSGW